MAEITSPRAPSYPNSRLRGYVTIGKKNLEPNIQIAGALGKKALLRAVLHYKERKSRIISLP